MLYDIGFSNPSLWCLHHHYQYMLETYKVPSILNDGFLLPTLTQSEQMEEEDRKRCEFEFTMEEEDDDLNEPMAGSATTKSTSRAALRFGKGIYFTSDVGRAAFHSEERGGQVILICDVVLGKAMQLSR